MLIVTDELNFPLEEVCLPGSHDLLAVIQDQML